MSDCSPYPKLLPDWLQDKAVADELFATAYESCSNAQRGLLKKTISLHFALSGEAPAHHSVEMEYPRLGVRVCSSTQPVDWCVLLLPHDFVSPVRALAAVVPPMLAGVRELVVVREKPEEEDHCIDWPAGVLVGLELAGVRRIVDLSCQEAENLLDVLLASNRSGRILLLDGGGSDFFSFVPHQIRMARNVRRWLGARPLIGVRRQPSESVAANGEILSSVLGWAHPDLTPDFCANDLPETSLKAYDALLVGEQELEKPRNGAGIVLGPGMEGCWFWPELNRDFFLLRTLCCSSSILSESE